jgi:AraC family transcriptional regulator of adaptative response/methylated-DNA-[protein]-cysteine methyltransferase
MAKTENEIFCKAYLERDPAFEGVFFVAVKTTGIFCRPTCPAKPKPENVEFYPSASEAMQNGYRPCKRCKPLEKLGDPPAKIKKLLKHMEENPTVKIQDADLEDFGLEPNQVRQWFLKNYKQTFHAYQKMYRSNNTFQRLQSDQSGYDSLKDFNSKFKKTFSPQKNKVQRVVNITYIETELGLMIAGATDKGLCLFEFADYKSVELQFRQLTETFKAPLVQGDHPHFHTLRSQLAEYFKGVRRNFDIPLDLAGTEFQKKVWLSLKKIPYGCTTNYAKQAERLGKPSAVRAVANANGKNKISIILPCHRVIGADGCLTGYGGGLWRKKKLLEFEQANLAKDG